MPQKVSKKVRILLPLLILRSELEISRPRGDLTKEKEVRVDRQRVLSGYKNGVQTDLAQCREDMLWGKMEKY